ncbi:uncharacterized protein CDAR_376041 [Caerostris darwini]|uniref:Fibronectin type-III domain-containing protein n=1 Tax=Caerostris darwini TaxID=1538125 RepID=A0AAV4UIE3_9ARAC|nr:uncharacterized protein CDAR_376041 [Caerostris darwini]
MQNPGIIRQLRILYKNDVCNYLKWKPPGNPAMVKGYVIEARRGEDEDWEELVNMSKPIVQVKICGSKHVGKQFRIRSYNEHGIGAPSQPVQSLRNLTKGKGAFDICVSLYL